MSLLYLLSGRLRFQRAQNLPYLPADLHDQPLLGLLFRSAAAYPAYRARRLRGEFHDFENVPQYLENELVGTPSGKALTDLPLPFDRLVPGALPQAGLGRAFGACGRRTPRGRDSIEESLLSSWHQQLRDVSILHRERTSFGGPGLFRLIWRAAAGSTLYPLREETR